MTVLIGGLLTPAAVATGEEASSGAASAPSHSAVAEPSFLPSLAAIAEPAPAQRAREIPRGELGGGPVREARATGAATGSSRAPVLDTSITPSSFSTPGRNHAGATSPFFPPDPIGDVGPDHYVQAINTHFAIYLKSDTSGTPVVGPSLISNLFAGVGGICETQDDGDPVVLYEQLATRFIVAQFALGAGPGAHRICFAISTTSDPTGAWVRYAFPTTEFPDYFKIGVWPDAYYVAWNQGDVGIGALERSEILAGAAAEILETSVSGHLGSNMMLPADADGATEPVSGAPGILYHHVDGAIAGGADRLRLRTVTPTFNGSPSTIVVSGPSNVPVAAFDGNFCGGIEFVECITQPGTAQKLDPIMEWPMWRLQYRNFGTHEALVGNFLTDVGGVDRAGIRWFELRRTPPATSGAWTLHQEGTYSPDATNRWMGSVAMDGQGNMALGYSASDGTSTFPSLWYAGRVADDAPGTLPRGEVQLVAGNSSQTANLRWGDYASMNVDPVDDCTFWFTGEYRLSTGGQETRIGTFSLCDTLTVLLAGTGNGTVTSSPGGISCPADCVEGYTNGDMVELTATPAGDGSFFDGWSGGGCAVANPCTVSVNQSTNVTATFTDPLKTLSVTTSGAGTGTVTSSPAGISCPPTCSAELATGSSVTLSVAPAASSLFAGWSGDCTGTEGCSVVMSTDRAVDAAFAQTKSLAVTLPGGGAGSVTSTPSGIACPPTCLASYLQGTTVALQASPDAGSWFAGWAGGCTGTASCDLTMTEERSVTATFEKQLKKSLAFKVTPGSVPPGGEVTLVIKDKSASGFLATCAHAGQKVKFQKKVPGKGGWKTVKKRKLTTKCKGKTRTTIDETTLFRVISKQQDADHTRTVSKKAKVQVV